MQQEREGRERTLEGYMSRVAKSIWGKGNRVGHIFGSQIQRLWKGKQKNCKEGKRGPEPIFLETNYNYLLAFFLSRCFFCWALKLQRLLAAGIANKRLEEEELKPVWPQNPLFLGFLGSQNAWEWLWFSYECEAFSIRLSEFIYKEVADGVSEWVSEWVRERERERESSHALITWVGKNHWNFSTLLS